MAPTMVGSQAPTQMGLVFTMFKRFKLSQSNQQHGIVATIDPFRHGSSEQL